MIEDEEEHLYGWGRFHPKWLQRFHNACCLITAMTLVKIIHGALMGGFNPASVSQWSKKFGFRNTEIAIINASFDFALIFALIVVAHYGNLGLGHKGRWLGFGIIIYSVGASLYYLPQFLSKPYDFAGSVKGNSSVPPDSHCILSNNNTNETLDDYDNSPDASSPIDYAFYCFIFASMLRGIGSSPLFALGTAYLDENVSQARSPKLLGFEMFGACFGPIFGAVFASFCLKIYGDIDKNIDLEKISQQINPEDPRWYGAWWIGYLSVGILGFFCAIPILGFARKLPSADEERKDDVSQEFKTQGSNKASTGLHELPWATFNLLRNHCFVALCAGQVSITVAISGIILFGPKLLEVLFHLDPSVSLLLCAFTGIVPGGIGMVIGGSVISKLKLKCKQIFQFSALCLLIVSPLMSITMLHCDQQPLAGVINVDYNNQPLKPGTKAPLLSPCNANCNCSDSEFLPVCSKATKLSYYSACHAGCTVPIHEESGITKRWSNCSCVETICNETSTCISDDSADVESGLCDGRCWRLYLFLLMMTLQTGTLGMQLPAMQQSYLRVVGVEQRTLALSISWIVARLLGTIPGQIGLGWILDTACELKAQESGDTDQSAGKVCVLYNSRSLAWMLSVCGITLSFMGSFFYMLAARLYKSAESLDDTKTDPKPNQVTSVDTMGTSRLMQ